MNRLKIISIVALIIIVLFGLTIYIPPTKLEFVDSTATLARYNRNNDTITIILEFTVNEGAPILFMFSATVHWEINNVVLGDSVPVFRHANGYWNSSEFTVPTATLKNAIGASLELKDYPSNFVLHVNGFESFAFSINTTITVNT